MGKAPCSIRFAVARARVRTPHDIKTRGQVTNQPQPDGARGTATMKTGTTHQTAKNARNPTATPWILWGMMRPTRTPMLPKPANQSVKDSNGTTRAGGRGAPDLLGPAFLQLNP